VTVGVGLFYLSFAFYQDEQHILAAAAVAAAVEDERDDSDDERKSREDVKVDDHNALAEGHEHVEKEVTVISHDGDDHQATEIREENVSTVVKAAVVEAKAEEVVKKVEVAKKLEDKNEVSRTLGLTTVPKLPSYPLPLHSQLTRMFLPIKCTPAA